MSGRSDLPLSRSRGASGRGRGVGVTVIEELEYLGGRTDDTWLLG